MSEKPERKFYLKQFKAISNAIATYDDFNVLADHLVEGVCRTFKVKGASIMILDEIERQLFRVSSFGISEAYLNKGPVFVDDKYCSLGTGLVEVVEDMQHDSRIQYPDAAAQENIASMIVIPIKYHQAVIGVMRIYHDEKLELHESDIDSLCVLSNQLGLVIQNNGLKNFVDHVKMAMDNLPPRILRG
ncbi:MAG: GAF domain-containing protein [Desulfobacteraceae bacterium]|nr:GAF domain-containing protein [Desulfobacteraceae bacterium]